MVKITKKREIPSTPIKKLMFEEGIHKNSSTNWNFGVERSKRIQRRVEKTKAVIEKDKATLRMSLVLVSFMNKMIMAPKRGSKIKTSNRLDSNILYRKLLRKKSLFSRANNGN